MKRFYKTTILLVIFTFVLTSVFCCCFIPEAESDEQLPECHQTQTQEHQKTDTCDCVKPLSIFSKKSIDNEKLTLVRIFKIDTDQAVYSQVDGNRSFDLMYFHLLSPPQLLSQTQDLFIQNSNLRL